MHSVFIAHHHDRDQNYKDALIEFNKKNKIFNDCSVDIGDISDDLDDDTIREKIRDEYLKDTSVTIVLVGLETWKRKHIDWEIYSSMFDGKINKKSGILVINLPPINCTYFTAPHSDEQKIVYPDISDWVAINTRSEYEKRYPYMPARITDNLIKKEAKISVVDWYKIENSPHLLSFLIDAAYKDRVICQYDLSRIMRRKNA